MDIPMIGKDIPYLDTQQMIEVDRAMMEDYTINLIQMMENAGRNLAHLARVRFLESDPVGKHVIVMAGTGGNGGGALVCARRLHNWGANVSVYITRRDEDFTPIPAHQLTILHKMNVTVKPAHEINQAGNADLIIDGLIGYSLKGAPTGSSADLIRWTNRQNTPVLALDVPSGVDTTHGTAFDPAIKATATLTLALPKQGLRAPGVANLVGELYLADISVPPNLYEGTTLGLKVGPLFATSEILRIW
jgi:NAD(P)H-hydrate epimerase